MSKIKEVNKYYSETAREAYERWQAGAGGYHFGYFDSGSDFHAMQPEQVWALHKESQIRMLDVVANFINPTPGSRILDNGCGEGSMFAGLARRGARVIGLNIVPRHLQRAQERIQVKNLHEARLVQADFSQLPFTNETFDTVLFFESLTHSPDQKTTLEEAARVLNDEGEMVIVEPMLVNKLSELGGQEQELVRQINQGMALEVTSLPTVMTVLEEIGFETVTIKDITENVLPSIQLAAASAEAHQGEEASDELRQHRQATIGYRELTVCNEMQYVLVKVKKKQT